MLKVNFNNRLHTQSPRVTARRAVLTTVLKHALLPAAITPQPPTYKYLPAKHAVGGTSEREGRAETPNKYEIAFPRRANQRCSLAGTSVLH